LTREQIEQDQAFNSFKPIYNLNNSEKSHYKLLEVGMITGVKPYVLRYWESQFSCLSPIVSTTGQKFYDKKSIEVINLIKNILFQKKKSIEQLTDILNNEETVSDAIEKLHYLDSKIEVNQKSSQKLNQKMIGFQKRQVENEILIQEQEPLSKVSEPVESKPEDLNKVHLALENLKRIIDITQELSDLN
jgi:DNA-binding transcriptional MerR regulator